MAALDSPARLDALERSGLLRKTPSERARHLVYTTYELLGVDAVLLNVVSDRVQTTVAEWPRTGSGLTIPVRDSGCQVVVAREETVAITDVKADPMMCVLPWASLYRGYIGTVICFDGQAVGSLCGLTLAPRPWSRQDIMTLEAMAGLVTHALGEDA